MLDTRNRKRQILEACLEKLCQDYEAAMGQLMGERGAIERKRLKRQADEISQQIDEVDGDLKSLALAPVEDAASTSKPDAARILHELRSRLPNIDFKALQEIIHRVLNEHRDGGFASLLLIQESRDRGGEWCAARIREIFQRETTAGLFRHYPVVFQAAEQSDSMTLLSRLGQYLGIEPTGQNQQGFSQCVIGKLCGSLQSGSVVMIECWKCDYLSDKTHTFDRILTFWENVVSELETVAKDYSAVKVIMLLFVEASLPRDCLKTDQRCTHKQFRKDKLLEITLRRRWTREDIKEWIAKYSELPLRSAEIERMADNIYESSRGGPGRVVEDLLTACCQVANR